MTSELKGIFDISESLEINTSKGTSNIKLKHFPALYGWEISRGYKEYIESKDSDFRLSFTIAVISYSEIETDIGYISLSNSDLINKHLEKWENIDLLFHSVLGFNGIKTDVSELERARWQVAGEDLAAAFIAAVSSLIGPAMELASEKDKEDGSD